GGLGGEQGVVDVPGEVEWHVGRLTVEGDSIGAVGDHLAYGLTGRGHVEPGGQRGEDLPGDLFDEGVSIHWGWSSFRLGIAWRFRRSSPRGAHAAPLTTRWTARPRRSATLARRR